MKLKTGLILLAFVLALVLAGGLAILVLTRLDSFPRIIQLLGAGASLVILVLLSFLLRLPTRKSECQVQQALAGLGFERESWISRQYLGMVNGCEFEILPFYIRGYGDTLALQILLRGKFNQQLIISLPRGLSNFTVWGVVADDQILPAGYAGLQILTRARLNAEAVLARPEMQRLVQELFNLPTQTPLVLEIAQGVIRLQIGRLAQLGFDVEMLRHWLVILGEIGQLAGKFQPTHSLSFDENEVPSIRSKTRRIGILVLLLTLALSTVLFLILLNYSR